MGIVDAERGGAGEGAAAVHHALLDAGDGVAEAWWKSAHAVVVLHLLDEGRGFAALGAV